MGGNALKNVKTRRYAKDEYWEVARAVTSKLLTMGVNCDVVPSYTSKDSFGDLDITVQYTEHLPERIYDAFAPQEIYVNVNTKVPERQLVSFNFDELQVDLIQCPEVEYDFTLKYYSFNDLGNLMSQVGGRFGLKFGFDGVKYPVTENGRYLGRVTLTQNFNEALRLFGYEPIRYAQGFETLEDVFHFVTTSPYFKPDLYVLSNRNAKARARDANRVNYRKFLEYCQSLPSQNYVEVDVKQCFDTLMRFPDFRRQYDALHAAKHVKSEFRTKFSGDFVQQLTGFTGRKLSFFMEHLRLNHDVAALPAVELETVVQREASTFQEPEPKNKKNIDADVNQ